MKFSLLMSLALRNLFRQKRRSLLLGIGIAFGMMVLVIASAFSTGLSDILLNKVIINMFGHISVASSEKTQNTKTIIRDRDRFIAMMTNGVEGIDHVRELQTTFTTAVGKGGTEIMVIIGITPKAVTTDAIGEELEGNRFEFTNTQYENPIIIYDKMAQKLKVKVHDTIRIKTQTIYGAVQTARLTVVAIMQSQNPFQDMTSFIPLGNLKKMLDLKPYETAGLCVILKQLNDPSLALARAKKIYNNMTPGFAGIYGDVKSAGGESKATVLGYYTNSNAMSMLASNTTIVAGALWDMTNKNTAIITRSIADRLKVKPGDKVTLYHSLKYGGSATNEYTIKAIFEPVKDLSGDLMIINRYTFFRAYCNFLPNSLIDQKDAFHPSTNSAMSKYIGKEWTLLERSINSDQMRKKWREFRKTDWSGTVIDIRTMYEMADQVLQMQVFFTMVSLVAVMILFFIVLIGIVNSLRMTIRERTREIGTIRAMGMQKKDVRTVFIAETMTLSFLATVGGVIAALIVMGLITLIKFEKAGDIGILLVNKHLYFIPNIWVIFFYMLFIVVVSGIVAYFPSKKASNMSVTEALGHFE